jgi:hypothetical protein
VSAQELHEVVRERPFQPFRLVLSDGGFHDVHHPDMMIVGVRTSYLGVPSERNPELAERSVRLDNMHITRVVPLPVNQATTSDEG